jgi:hypothetical protein
MKSFAPAIGALNVNALKVASAIQTTAAFMRPNNISEQVFSTANLAATFAPMAFGKFAASSLGSTVLRGVSAIGAADIITRLTGESTVGRAAGVGLSVGAGALMGGPAGALVGGLVAVGKWLFGGGRAREEARRRRLETGYAIEQQQEALGEQVAAIQEQKEGVKGQRELLAKQGKQLGIIKERATELIGAQREHLQLGEQSIKRQKEDIANQLQGAEQLAVLNYETVAQDEGNAGRVRDVKDWAIQRAVRNITGTQKVAFAASGFLSRGTSWVVLGNTENMGYRQQQELEAEYRVVMNQLNRQRYEITLGIEAFRREATSADYQLGVSLDTLKSTIGRNIRGIELDAREAALTLETNALQIQGNIRVLQGNIRNLQGNIKSINRNLRYIEDVSGEYADYNRLQRARNLADYGSAIASSAWGDARVAGRDAYATGSYIGDYVGRYVGR